MAVGRSHRVMRDSCQWQPPFPSGPLPSFPHRESALARCVRIIVTTLCPDRDNALTNDCLSGCTYLKPFKTDKIDRDAVLEL